MKRAALAVLLLVAACDTDYPAHPEVVDRLRVLGLRADPPEAAPGDTVALTALVADPAGPREIYRQWLLCPTVGTLEGEADIRSCAGSGRVLLGSTASVSFVVPDDLVLAEGEWVDLVVGLEVAAGAERDLVAKRVRISVSATPNRNPEFPEVRLDGAPLTTAQPVTWGGFHDLALDATDPDGHGLDGELFVSAGVFDGDFGNRGLLPFEVTWRLDGEHPGPQGRVWLLVRDGLGGVAFGERDVTFPE